MKYWNKLKSLFVCPLLTDSLEIIELKFKICIQIYLIGLKFKCRWYLRGYLHKTWYGCTDDNFTIGKSPVQISLFLGLILSIKPWSLLVFLFSFLPIRLFCISVFTKNRNHYTYFSLPFVCIFSLSFYLLFIAIFCIFIIIIPIFHWHFFCIFSLSFVPIFHWYYFVYLNNLLYRYFISIFCIFLPIFHLP